MWQGARPHTPPFIVLDGVGETTVTERALGTQRFSNPHRILTSTTVREVFGEKNLWNVLAWCTPVSVNSGTKIPVSGLSVEAHKVILKEEPNE